MTRIKRLGQWLDAGSFALGVVAEGVAQLRVGARRRRQPVSAAATGVGAPAPAGAPPGPAPLVMAARSEERRVGKECRL